ncbi:hypothetical protein GXM_07869 [Nostoc sphaeroides CCNUC1]|uniref:Uncharacterized protein n=1 Tax=Nostoc sphaeroides CCNUC1 TaxID=2653204 RepID=A0A5P8WC23_9NOSO|nr:hypothetical protein GXM_07869 [Nostoc sphaeroides CCNUC1]
MGITQRNSFFLHLEVELAFAGKSKVKSKYSPLSPCRLSPAP